MRSSGRLLLLFGITAALVACGGGGGSGDAASSGAAAAPPVTGAATAVLSASTQTAGEVVAVAKAGASSVEKIDGFSSLPLGVQVSAPTGVITTETHVCTSGGSFVLNADTASTSALTTGDSLRLVFDHCAENPVTFSGTVALKVTRFATDTDFAFNFDATNFVITSSGLDRSPVSFSGQIDFSNNSVSYAYIVDGNTVVGAPVLSRSGNTVAISSATTRSNLGTSSGFVEVRFSNWRFDRSTGRPTAGTATITAANGNTGTVKVTATGYQVVLLIGGVSSNYTVAF